MKYIKSLLSVCFMLSLINLNAQRISEQFKTHWFDGYAEISSYSLDQSRYGEVREGNAVLIYVTEDFLKKEQVPKVLEIIKKDNNGFGEVVLTDIFDLSFPKIRYRNGDKSKMHKTSTSFKTIIYPVMGRLSDYLLIPEIGKLDGRQYLSDRNLGSHKRVIIQFTLPSKYTATMEEFAQILAEGNKTDISGVKPTTSSEYSVVNQRWTN